MKRADQAAFLLIAAIVVYQTMIPPVVSLGNNGDFGKISGHFSIGYPPELEVRYAPVKFHRDARYRWPAPYRSTENLLANAAMGLSWVTSKSSEFDIRAMGAIHGRYFSWRYGFCCRCWRSTFARAGELRFCWELPSSSAT